MAGRWPRCRALCLVAPLLLAGAGCTGASDAADGAHGGQTPPAEKRVASAPANGWGDDIAWRGLQEGLEEAKSKGMPVMLVVHTSWCTKCKSLKKAFAQDADIAELSERFVMVNVDQDEMPQVEIYGPDGTYIPRVVILSPDGKVDTKLINPRSPRYKYFYAGPDNNVAATMRQALERYGKTS